MQIPLSNRLASLVHDSVQILERVAGEHARVVYANSLGSEGVVLTDLICTHVPKIEIFTIDTGRLHEETRELLERLERRYDRRITVFHPDGAALERWTAANGLNAFYSSVDLRRSCCELRKLEPFARALRGADAWITGVRRAQSMERAQGEVIERDERFGLWQVRPLLDWREQDVWDYLHARGLPYNPLHDKGYPSIGCAPCTRPVAEGEDARAGRWWWENPQTRECGLQPRRNLIPIVAESPRRAGC
jgi:phosphoadenosine phosphosulfate reductase